MLETKQSKHFTIIKLIKTALSFSFYLLFNVMSTTIITLLVTMLLSQSVLLYINIVHILVIIIQYNNNYKQTKLLYLASLLAMYLFNISIPL